jgi:nucleolar pre-ribosomal-associated protein 1
MSRRVFEEGLPARYTKADEHLYDPVFILLLFARMLEEGTPTYATAWVELFRTNVVSLLLRCLSAKYGDLRDLALSQIAGLWKVMEVRIASCETIH